MIDALNPAVSGLRFYTGKAEEAARDIVNAGLSAHSAAPQNQATPVPSPASPLPSDPDLLGATVDLKLAEIGYKASAKVAAAVSDMQKQLVDILK